MRKCEFFGCEAGLISIQSLKNSLVEEWPSHFLKNVLSINGSRLFHDPVGCLDLVGDFI